MLEVAAAHRKDSVLAGTWKSSANQIAIAKAAGVSVSTVSRALAGGGGISEKRRRQIRELAEDVGYLKRGGKVPVAARSLRAYVTASLAMGGLAPFYEAVIAGLRASSGEAGFSLSVLMVNESALAPERIVRDQKTEEAGIVMFVGIDPSDPVIAHLVAEKEKVILVNGYDPQMRFDCVAPNNFYGAFAAGKTLLEAGHRNLLYIHDHTRWTTIQRRRGFYAAVDEFPEATLTSIGIASGTDRELIAEIERRVGGVSGWTGAFAANDMAAFRLVTALDAAGLSVPQDVSVVGFDDLPYAVHMHPRLSTMRVDCAEVALQAIALAQRRIACPDCPPAQIECAVTFEARGTVAQIA